MPKPTHYHDIPNPSSAAAGRNNKAGTGELSARNQAKKFRPFGADPNEPDLATLARFAVRLIDRVTSKEYSADELLAQVAAAASVICHPFVGVGLMIPDPNAAPEVITKDSGDKHVIDDQLSFDKDAVEKATFTVKLDRWDGGTIKFRPHWTAINGTIGHKAAWKLKARVALDTTDANTDYGSPATAVGVYATANTNHCGVFSDALTVAGAVANARIEFCVYRLGTDATNDTLAFDAALYGIELEYTKTATAETAWA